MAIQDMGGSTCCSTNSFFFVFFFGPIQHIEGFSILSNDTEMAGILKGTSRINPTP